MEETLKYNEINDYFKGYNDRKSKSSFFYKIISYNEEVEVFLKKYLYETNSFGIYIRNNIKNPSIDQTEEFLRVSNSNFIIESSFFYEILNKWISFMSDTQKEKMAIFMYEVLKEIEEEGKNSNILKNIFIKYMCWLKYEVKNIFKVGNNDIVPKVLFEGNANSYELKFLKILALMKIDVVILNLSEESEPVEKKHYSEPPFIVPYNRFNKFPKDYCINDIKIEKYQQSDELITNKWVKRGFSLEESLKNSKERGDTEKNYHNIFIKKIGVSDKINYKKYLFMWDLKIENSRRGKVLIEGNINNPDGDEVQKIKNIKDTTEEELIENLTSGINTGFKELDVFIKNAFFKIMRESKGEKINKIKNSGILLICWLNRYIPILFKNKNLREYPVFIYYGECKNENIKKFIRLLGKIPVDVLIICPDKSLECKIEDKELIEEIHDYSVKTGEFPKKVEGLNTETVAYNAERDLDKILYEDTGLFRQNQFKKAIPIILKTTYEEIEILWAQESKYRQNFEVLTDRVMVPTICSKICGVPNGDKERYWSLIEKFLQEDGIFISQLPFAFGSGTGQSGIKYIMDKTVRVDKIKNDSKYKYNFIRVEMQNFMFEKIQELLDSGIIPGTFTNGMEFKILETLLNLDIKILQLIQKYDFTKKIPKIVILDIDEKMGSTEDIIILAFLKYIGFDIILFVPTGYQSIDGQFEKNIFIEHQVGEYIYDMKMPKYDEIKKRFVKSKLNIWTKQFF